MIAVVVLQLVLGIGFDGTQGVQSFAAIGRGGHRHDLFDAREVGYQDFLGAVLGKDADCLNAKQEQQQVSVDAFHVWLYYG